MQRSKDTFQLFIITFFFPIFGLYYSIKKLNWDQRKWILIFFVTIFGSTLVLVEGADSTRYQIQVLNYVGMSSYEFWRTTKNIITFSPLPGEPTDLYIHVVSFFTGSILNSPFLFFPLVSFVFAYFYINGLSKILVYNRKTHKGIIFNTFVLLFIIHRGVDMMQSIRTWTGMWVLFNGFYSFNETKKIKYFFLMLTAPLIHFGYFLIAIPAILTVFFQKISAKIIILIYFLSFLMTLNPVGFLNTITEYDLGKQKAGYYKEGEELNSDDMQTTNTHWYAKYGRTSGVYLGGNLLAFTLILGGFYKKRMTKIEIALFTTGILMATLANLGSSIYVFYSRTMANAVLYILATVVLLMIRGELISSEKKIGVLFIRIMILFSLIIFIPKIVFTLSNFLYYTSIFIFAAPFLAWFPDVNISIREFIEWFF